MTGPLPNDVDDAVRTLLALPADNWEPHHWDALDAVRSVLGAWMGKWDRQATTRHPAAAKAKKRGPASPELTLARLAVIQRSRGRCEVQEALTCRDRGDQAHHVQRRSQGGKDTAGNLLYVCAPCHGWIHANPAESFERGWLAHAAPLAAVVDRRRS